MTRTSLLSRSAAALFSSVLILALTVDILDEIPSGEQPPAAVERAPITSPQLDGPYFQQEQAEIQAEAEVKAEGAAPVVSAAVETPQVPGGAAPAAAEAASTSPQMAN